MADDMAAMLDDLKTGQVEWRTAIMGRLGAPLEESRAGRNAQDRVGTDSVQHVHDVATHWTAKLAMSFASRIATAIVLPARRASPKPRARLSRKSWNTFEAIG